MKRIESRRSGPSRWLTANPLPRHSSGRKFSAGFHRWLTPRDSSPRFDSFRFEVRTENRLAYYRKVEQKFFNSFRCFEEAMQRRDACLFANARCVVRKIRMKTGQRWMNVLDGWNVLWINLLVFLFFFFFSQYEYETREIRFNRIYESNLYDRFIYTNKEW